MGETSLKEITVQKKINNFDFKQNILVCEFLKKQIVRSKIIDSNPNSNQLNRRLFWMELVDRMGLFRGGGGPSG